MSALDPSSPGPSAPPAASLAAAVTEVRAGLAAGGLAVATAGALALHATPALGLALIGGGVAAGALTLTPGLALLVGVTGWALLTGFLEPHAPHDAGRLTLHAADAARLVTLLGVAALAARAGRLGRAGLAGSRQASRM